MSDASSPNVITIDGRAIEYRLERRGDTTALILHGGHMSAQCRFGEETFLEAGYSVLVTSRPGYGRTAVSAGPSAPEFAIRLAGLGRLPGLGNLTVVGISLGARSAIPVSTSHAAWDVDAVHGVHAAYSVNNVGTALVFVEEWPARRGLHIKGGRSRHEPGRAQIPDATRVANVTSGVPPRPGTCCRAPFLA